MGPRVANDKPISSEEFLDDLEPPSIETKEIDWNPMDNIVWFNVFWYLALHLGAFYGLYLAWSQAKLATIIFTLVIHQVSLLGITAGVHRLWSHRSYKAKLPFRLFLAFCNSMSAQNSIYEWSRDHRAHHKYSETNGDPHNSNRGFFFCHMGWLMVRKHPEVKRLGAKIDLSDLLADPVVYFQARYYILSVILACVVIPTLIPYFLWSESLWISYWVAVNLRYILQLHVTWTVNSLAHMWGYKPYDKHIASAENPWVSTFALGEGHHNYHHTFPWDYSTSEWGWSLNLTTFVLDTAAKLGLVYDRKKVAPEVIQARRQRTGDLSNSHSAS